MEIFFILSIRQGITGCLEKLVTVTIKKEQ